MDGYKRILRTIYSPGNYFQRAYAHLGRTKINNLPAPRVFHRENIRSLIRSMFIQGSSRYSLTYLWIICRSIFRHPRQIESIIELAIKEHHFFTITRNTLQADWFASQVQQLKHQIIELAQKFVQIRTPRRELVQQDLHSIRRNNHRLLHKFRTLNKEVRSAVRPHLFDLIGICTRYSDSMPEIL